MKEDFEYSVSPDNVLEIRAGEGRPEKYRSGIDALREEPTSAFDEGTGEINWDCPCLKSALAPPCGDFFREAFSCFVSSKAEPKGSDCLEKFSMMQDCFRAHPEIYMKDDDDNVSTD